LCTYVLSGCDTVSYPFRQGKCRAAKVGLNVIGDMSHIVAFADEDNLEITNAVTIEGRNYTIALYGHGHSGFDSLDALCQHIFAKSR
jgi:hypothetical protein